MCPNPIPHCRSNQSRRAKRVALADVFEDAAVEQNGVFMIL
ncbi:hypothetical protein RRSWK_00814 [Rhodopirellula sp. SWK7]|nr:hypothetical protein RRSWK_00814 [Rhodopirellula sp. SWK7]